MPPTAWGHRAGSSLSTWSVSGIGTLRHGGTSSAGANHKPCLPPPQDEPTLTERGCPTHRIWVEGERRELLCHADGDPPPSTRCARDGGTVGRSGMQRVVRRADAGRYICRAINKHGTAVRSVVVTVECECQRGREPVVPGMGMLKPGWGRGYAGNVFIPAPINHHPAPALIITCTHHHPLPSSNTQPQHS